MKLGQRPCVDTCGLAVNGSISLLLVPQNVSRFRFRILLDQESMESNTNSKYLLFACLGAS